MQDLPDSLFSLWNFFEHIFSQYIESIYKEKSEFIDFMLSHSKMLAITQYSTYGREILRIVPEIKRFGQFLNPKTMSFGFMTNQSVYQNKGNKRSRSKTRWVRIKFQGNKGIQKKHH